MKAYTMGISKEEFINEIKLHMELDNFIKGTYSDGEKGCAVGCSLKSVAKLKDITLDYSCHKEYENHLGIPEWLARVEDAIFEGISLERSKKWPSEFSEAINIGSNLEDIKLPFIIFILENNIKVQKELLKQTTDLKLRKIIKDVIEANKNMIAAQKSGNLEIVSAVRSAAWSTESAAESAAWLAESAARSAAWSTESAAESAASAAESAAWSAAASAARSAAWSTESAAASAARSAAWSTESAAESAASAARSAARSTEYEIYADKLLELMRGCK